MDGGTRVLLAYEIGLVYRYVPLSKAFDLKVKKNNENITKLMRMHEYTIKQS